MIEDNISPEKKEINPAIMENPQTIRVGKLGTVPLWRYLIKIGTKKHIAKAINKTDTEPKNSKGLYVLNKLNIVFITFIPSE